MTEPGERHLRIVAVVLTYNRLISLRECLLAIQRQSRLPAKIIVIDNASTDGTPQMLAREFPGVEVVRLAENTGYTGGLHAAFRAGVAASPDYVWFFDDDAVAEPACLEILLREMSTLDARGRVGILRPQVRDAVTGDVMGGGMSCGTLLRADMVSTVTLPPAELFMEFDDKIYSRLARSAGYDIVRLSLPLVRHPVRRPQTLPRIVTEGYQVSPWRLYYGVRNRIYYSLYKERSLTRFLASVGVGMRAVVLLTLFGRPRRGQGLILRGIIDGVLGRLGRRVAPAY